ncbi:phosphatidylserine decarboxylase 1 [Coprinopsis sp. MPI-PUGE-AT-0042]|nr:phosphatidylserine decarboxylase 1 [Coprinopsis sp. MPI-PUGE-AT-0042]
MLRGRITPLTRSNSASCATFPGSFTTSTTSPAHARTLTSLRGPMLFSRKNIITAGKRPVYAATRVINASCGSATSVFARCWVHSTNKTGALLRKVKNSGLKRAYSTKGTSDNNNLGAGGTGGQPLYRKVISAWQETPTKWYPLPLAVGALLLVAIQYRRKARKTETIAQLDEEGREIVRLKGPWHVHVIGALPLRNMSRLWGYVNSLELPVWFRPYGYKLYAYAFRTYPSLGAFFYRKLKDGARPVDPAVLVKGITYHLDALLGVERPGSPVSVVEHNRDMSTVDDQEFANVNGIDYTLDQLLGAPPNGAADGAPRKFGEQIDASVVHPSADTVVHDTTVALEMGVKPTLQRQNSLGSRQIRPGNSLYFTVIYLAPGDYHRFHSPTAWVVEKRRHFVGELFSVSPWMAKRLENLFVLNERVALLGRWKHGFFSMVPVNFDQALRTNVRGRPPPPGTYTEAVYSAASPILRGQPLTPAEEMGGFCLGSTIVLVFEAPEDFQFDISAGQKVKVGQRLGDLADKSKKD